MAVEPLIFNWVLANWLMVPAPVIVRLPVAAPPVVSILPRTLVALELISDTSPPPLATEPPPAKLVAAVPLAIDTAVSVAVIAPLITTALLPLVSVKPPGVVMTLTWPILLDCVPRFSALAAPESVAASVAAFTTPVCVTDPPATRMTPPPLPVPLLMPEIATALVSVYWMVAAAFAVPTRSST